MRYHTASHYLSHNNPIWTHTHTHTHLKMTRLLVFLLAIKQCLFVHKQLAFYPCKWCTVWSNFWISEMSSTHLLQPAHPHWTVCISKPFNIVSKLCITRTTQYLKQCKHDNANFVSSYNPLHGHKYTVS